MNNYHIDQLFIIISHIIVKMINCDEYDNPFECCDSAAYACLCDSAAYACLCGSAAYYNVCSYCTSEPWTSKKDFSECGEWGDFGFTHEIDMYTMKLNHCDCQDMHPLNFDDDHFNVWEKSDDIASGGTIVPPDGQIIEASCPRCDKQYVLTPEDVERYNNRRVTCHNCKKLVNIATAFHTENMKYCNGTFNNTLVKINFKKLNLPSQTYCKYLCKECVEFCGYHEIPEHIYCDLCHSAHTRLFGSDTQGSGLCGTVMHNCVYPTHWKWWVDSKQFDDYIINCEFGSNYDAEDDPTEFIKFTSRELPDGIKIGMEICDECIAKFIDDGVCIKPDTSTHDDVKVDP